MASSGAVPAHGYLSVNPLGSIGKEPSATSPRTPSPVVDRSVLTATPTPLRRQGVQPSIGPTKPPRFVYHALREEDDKDLGLSAIEPDEAVEPPVALSGQTRRFHQYLFTTSNPEAALFFAETARGPGFANPPGCPSSPTKRAVVKIDLAGFKGEILDFSCVAGCEHYGLQKNSKGWNFAIDHQIVLLVGYVPPRLLVANFDLEETPLPMRSPRSVSARQALAFDAFSAALNRDVKKVLVEKWVGEGRDQRLSCPPGGKTRDEQGRKADDSNRAAVFWDVKQRLDEELRKLETRRQRLEPKLEDITERELSACTAAYRRAHAEGVIGPVEESHILVMKGWRCIEEYPFWAATSCIRESEVRLRGTAFQARLALNGPAALDQVYCTAGDVFPESPCKHCLATKPAEFHLLRNVRQDGASVTWPPYFRLLCFDSDTQELEELLNTLGGSHVRDCEHPHVFPSDEVGFSFPLERLPVALAGLEATLPRMNVECTEEVALPQRPLYIVMVVPQGVPQMQGYNGDAAPIIVPAFNRT